MKALINATTMERAAATADLHRCLLRVYAEMASVQRESSATMVNATTVRSAPREMRATQACAFAERPPARRNRHTARRLTVLVRIPLLSLMIMRCILTAPQRRACAKASGAWESASQTQGVLSPQRTRSGTKSRRAKTGKTNKSAYAGMARFAMSVNIATPIRDRAL